LNHSEAQKNLWNNPEYRKKQCKKMKSAWTKKRREELRKRLIGRELSPDTIRKISESNIRTWRRKNGIA